MKTYPKPQPRRRHPKRVPAFIPVPMRPRADGWTAQRQAAFLVALAQTRSVLAAARKVGMARESVYRLRKAPGGDSFARAWDHVLGRAAAKRKCTADEQFAHAFGDAVRPVVWQGELRALPEISRDSALLGYLARLDRTAQGSGERKLKSHEFPPGWLSTGGAG